MKQYLPLVFIICAFFAAVISLISDDSYGRLIGLKRSLAAQRDTNAELEARVTELRSKVSGLRANGRELEKAARNELGMARPGELIFFFEKKSGDRTAPDSENPEALRSKANAEKVQKAPQP